MGWPAWRAELGSAVLVAGNGRVCRGCQEDAVKGDTVFMGG